EEDGAFGLILHGEQPSQRRLRVFREEVGEPPLVGPSRGWRQWRRLAPGLDGARRREGGEGTGGLAADGFHRSGRRASIGRRLGRLATGPQGKSRRDDD